MHTLNCPICQLANFSVFHELTQLPVHVGVLWPSEQEARNCPKGDMALAYCRSCGFIQNIAFDPTLVNYHLAYDNALHFSNVFQDYEYALASRLIDRYGIRHKRVLEIGCGSGHFLGLLCDLGANTGIGFDPGHDPQRVDRRAVGKIRFVRDYYSDQYTATEAELICCRHVLEHLREPQVFLRMIHKTVASRPDTVLYFEVPNARLILHQLSIWDMMYEHCNYFTVESLGYLFATCGFQVLDLQETYAGQFVSIEARPVKTHSDTPLTLPHTLAELTHEVAAFGRRFNDKKAAWQQRLAEFAQAGKRAVVWGGGGKAVGFLNMLELSDPISHVVDVNPGKQGTFLAGGGQPIVAPAALQTIKPDVVIIMNPIYRDEIQQLLTRLDLGPELLTV